MSRLKGRPRRRAPFLLLFALVVAEAVDVAVVCVAEEAPVVVSPKCGVDTAVVIVARSTGLVDSRRVKASEWRVGFGRLLMVAWTANVLYKNRRWCGGARDRRAEWVVAGETRVGGRYHLRW